MRSGKERSLAIAIAAITLTSVCFSAGARAGDIFHHTIPRETLAMDYRTGGVMMAPPIPYGEYAKDYAGTVHGAIGHVAGSVHGMAAHVADSVHGAAGHVANAAHRLCGKCGGAGLFHGKTCGGCGGDGCTGCGSEGMAVGHGHGDGSSLFHGGLGGLFGHKGGQGSGTEYVQTLNTGHGMHGGSGVSCVGPGCNTGYASSQSAPIAPAMASQQGYAPCGGCGGVGKLGTGGGCGLCGGTGKLKSLLGKFCGNCRGNGCGGCGGTGLLSDGHGHGLGLGHGGKLCGGCGGKGCGLCGKLCGGCGGKGCGLCGKLAGLKGKAHHILGAPMGLVNKITHKGQIEYFVGPGGPVPITPGYVPYVVTTRSPRDFFAFPPFSDQVP